MKKTLMMLAAMAAATALATPYAWTGSSSANTWNDSQNWDPAGIPGGGDTATFTKTATIADGIAVSSGELKIVADGVAVTLNGVISGAGALYFNCTNKGASKIVLAGANTYSGGTTIDAYNDRIANNESTYPLTHGVWLQNASALGTAQAITQIGGMIVFNCANATFVKNFTTSGNRVIAYAAMKTCTIDGTIGGDAFTGVLYFAAKVAGVTMTVTGKVGGPNASTVYTLCSGQAGSSRIYLDGGIETKKSITQNTSGDGWSFGTTRLGTSVKAESLIIAYSHYQIKANGNDILNENTLLDFTGYSDGAHGELNLNGTRQTVNRIQSQTTGAGSNCRFITSAAATTLTLRPTQSSLGNAVKVDGAVTLVMDAKESTFVQQFTNRVSATTGSLIASNGILRIGYNAKFANVPKLRAANHGAIEVTADAAAGALVGVREIVVEDYGRVSLPTSVLRANAIAVTLAPTATLELTDGVTFEVASLKIGDAYVVAGTHAAGTIPQITGAAVAVPNPVSASSTGVWTGGGSTESSNDPDNWEGGYPGVIPVTFATGGTRAQLVGNLVASDVRFDTPEGTPAFTVEPSATTPDAKLYAARIVMTNTAHASGHTNAVTAPVVFTGSTGTIDVDGTANALTLAGPLAQQEASVTLVRKGSGTLFLEATNSTLAGTVYLRGGKTYLQGGAVDGTPAAPTTVGAYVPDYPYDTWLYLTGGTYNQKFHFKRSGNYELNVTFLAGTTNIVNGSFTMQNNYTLIPTFRDGSRTVFNGGLIESWEWGYSVFFKLYGGAEVEIREKPLNVTATSPGDARFYAQSNGKAKRSRLLFATTGNYARDALYLGGPLDVDFETDFAFNTNAVGVGTPLAIVCTPPDGHNDNVKPTIVDLHGHDQRFGRLVTQPHSADSTGWVNSWGSSPYSCITSATPATVYVVQNGMTNDLDRSFMAMFTGAVSLVKEGTNTLALSGNSLTTGRLEVACGRLEFKGSGAMTNLTAIAVSGGVLVVDTERRLSRTADCYLSGGKLDVAAGVVQRVRYLYVADGNGGWRKMPLRRYTAADLPDYISGGGVLRPRGDGIGMVINFK